MLDPTNLELLKFIHIAGVTIFLGNVIVTAVWKILANATRDAKIVAYSQRLVTITDIVFTFGGVVMIVVSGNILALKFGGVTATSWIIWGQGMFYLSALIWVFVLIPVQFLQSRMAQGFRNGGPIPDRYWTLANIWNVAGIAAIILPLASMYFMVFRPG